MRIPASIRIDSRLRLFLVELLSDLFYDYIDQFPHLSCFKNNAQPQHLLNG